MKYDDKKTLTISILMIVILTFLSYRNFTNVSLPEKENVPPIEIPDIKLPSVEEIMSEAEKIMPDTNPVLLDNNIAPSEIRYTDHNLTNKIKFQYPSNWVKSSPRLVEEYNNVIEPLFVAFSQDMTPTIIIGLRLISQNDSESVIKTMKNIFQREGVVMNVLNKNSNNDKIYFKTEYLHQDGSKLISKERIILMDNNAYLISVISPEERFNQKVSQMEYIINSIQIIN